MTKNNLIDTSLYNKRELLFTKLFWTGFFLFLYASIIATTGIIAIKYCQLFQGIGFIILLITTAKLVRFQFESIYLKITFSFYIIWSLIIIFRGAESFSEYDFIKEFLFGGANHGLFYFIPVVLLFRKDFKNYKILFNAIFLFGLGYALSSIIFINQLLAPGGSGDRRGLNIVESISALSLPMGFILLTSIYHSKKKNIITVAIVIITLLFAIIRARRGLILITSSIILSAALLNFYYSRKKITLVYLSVFFVLLATLYSASIFDIHENKIFSFLAERGTEDTRTLVELYFFDDMKETDWWIGKGVNGSYFCPDIEENQQTNYRYLIETGYLQMALKGGIVYILVILLILIPAILKGLFFSKNMFSKAAAIWILLFLIKSYPTIATSFDPSYLLVWFSVGACYSKEIRQMNDNEVRIQLHG